MGALCIAYSGRCLLSGYMNHRDSNQGSCTNACRWNYGVNEADVTPEGNVQLKVLGQPTAPTAPDGRMFLLEESQRPGEFMPAFEDEHGTYIMNSRDLRAVEHVRQFTEMGLSSLKIEGRTKSFFYVARTAQAYRQGDRRLSRRPRSQRVGDAQSQQPLQPGLYRRFLQPQADLGTTELRGQPFHLAPATVRGRCDREQWFGASDRREKTVSEWATNSN